MNNDLNLNLDADELLELGDLIGLDCDDSASTVIGSYNWIHSCSDDCPVAAGDCSLVTQIGNFCTGGDAICMKASSTIVGGEYSSPPKMIFFFF